MVNTVLLKPKFELLNSNFDGYKLKSDPHSSVYSKQVDNGIYQFDSQDATCYLYTRMESLHNHLFSDPFEALTIYVFNSKAHLLMYTFYEAHISSAFVVWQENLDSQRRSAGVGEGESDCTFHYSPSLSFPSTSHALTSNGSGSLNILETGDRSVGSSWVNVKELKVCNGKIVNSLLIEKSDESIMKQEIHCLMLSVTTPQELKDNSLYQNIDPGILNSKVSALHVIYWYTFGFDGVKWDLKSERRIIGLKTLEYVSLDRKGKGVVLLSHENYQFVYDSLHPLQKAEQALEKVEKVLPKYVFMQDNEEIKLWLNLGPETCKRDLHVDIHVRDIKVRIKNKVILDKQFVEPIDSFATTWTFANGKLEICLMKSRENVRWRNLFDDVDKEGEELIDPKLVDEVHNRLAHLTSDQWDANPDLDKPAFNPGQLEDCDDACDDLFLTILDGETQSVSHLSYLGAVQHLFNVQLEKSVIPSFCLRHDVDGIVWEHDEDRTFDHIATFNAFGYVRASKSMAKFTQSSPDNSYVAVADVNSHVYVFCQPESLGGELRNRKSGKLSTTVAWQLIISLRNHDQVMGFYCAPNYIFVLTTAQLFVYDIQTS